MDILRGVGVTGFECQVLVEQCSQAYARLNGGIDLAVDAIERPAHTDVQFQPTPWRPLVFDIDRRLVPVERAIAEGGIQAGLVVSVL